MANTFLGATPLTPTPGGLTLPAGLVPMRPSGPQGICGGCSGLAAAGCSVPEQLVVQSWGGGAAFRADVMPQPSVLLTGGLQRLGRLLPPGTTDLLSWPLRPGAVTLPSTRLRNRGTPPILPRPSPPSLSGVSAKDSRLPNPPHLSAEVLGRYLLKGARTSQATLPPGGVPLR